MEARIVGSGLDEDEVVTIWWAGLVGPEGGLVLGGWDVAELSDRGLAWSNLKGNPGASTSLLRSIARGTFAARAAGIPWGELGGIGVLGAGALISAAHQAGKTDRARVEAAIRTRLAEKLATADLGELIEIAQAVEARSERASDADPRE